MSKSNNIIYLHALQVTPERAARARMRIDNASAKNSASVMELDAARSGHRFSGLNREQVLNRRLGDAKRERDSLLFSIGTAQDAVAMKYALQGALQELERLIARTKKALADEINR